MAFYAIGDLHLSLGSQKPMDVFGGRWLGYTEKIRESLEKLRDEDTLLLCGDTSWGMSLEESGADFRFLAGFRGEKILLKGNHDYWWTTVAKMNRFFAEAGLNQFRILHNNCYRYGDIAICGTRGWFYEEQYQDGQDEKVFKRELQRLETSLQAGRASGCPRIYVFLHYPPLTLDYECAEILQKLIDYSVERVYYGHLHGSGQKRAFEGDFLGIQFQMISADHLAFEPLKLID